MLQRRLGDVAKVDEFFNVVAGNGVFGSFDEKAALSYQMIDKSGLESSKYLCF